jgi:hypothetical protein
MLAFKRAVYMVSSSDLRASNSSIFFHFFFKESSASFLSAHNLFKRCISAIRVFKLAFNPETSRSFAQTSNCTNTPKKQRMKNSASEAPQSKNTNALPFDFSPYLV